MYLILGMGKTGESVASFLEKNNIAFKTFDDAKDNLPFDLEGITAIVKSPGIPPDHPLLQNDIPHISDFHFFKAPPGARIIAVTGTNGKTTYTQLITHVLKTCGINASCGGNCAPPILDMPQSDVYVLELSSFQLMHFPPIPLDIAILLNITDDHVSYHGSMESYVDAKMNIFRMAKHKFSTDAHYGKEFFVPFDELLDRIAGMYNFDRDKVRDAVASFTKPAHRLQKIAEKNGVIYMDDSKATNFDSVRFALDHMNAAHDIHLIFGNRFKSRNVASILESLKKATHIYVIGEACEFIAEYLHGLPFTLCFDLESAVQSARNNIDRSKTSVILLSPGGSSYDQYKNFEERGKHFQRLVNLY